MPAHDTLCKADGRVALLTSRHQVAGGVKAAMGYVGAATIPEFQHKARFARITNARLRESQVHDVTISREAPNYPTR